MRRMRSSAASSLRERGPCSRRERIRWRVVCVDSCSMNRSFMRCRGGIGGKTMWCCVECGAVFIESKRGAKKSPLGLVRVRGGEGEGSRGTYTEVGLGTVLVTSRDPFSGSRGRYTEVGCCGRDRVRAVCFRVRGGHTWRSSCSRRPRGSRRRFGLCGPSHRRGYFVGGPRPSVRSRGR